MSSERTLPETETLLPCPFCGATQDIDQDVADTGVFWVRCSECCAESAAADTREEAALRWNTRKPGHAQTPVLADPIKAALIGLNDAIDLYWNEGRTEGQVKNICYWQFKAKEALAQGPDTSTLQTNREGK